MVQTNTKTLRNRVPPTPKFLKDKPTLDISLIWYWDSFLQLNSTRFKDFGEIPWTAIDSYCDRWGIVEPEEFDSFCYIIKSIDKVYLEELKEKENVIKN